MPNQRTRSELFKDSKQLVAKSLHLKAISDQIISQCSFGRRHVMKPAIQAPAKAPSLQGARFSNGTAKEQNEPERHSEVLNSWKEIAVYLGRGVRTAQRWERELQLPVRRPRERSRSAVIAFRSELDRWLLAVDTNGGATEPDENPLSELAKLEQRLLWLQTEIQTVQNQINDIKKHVPEAPKTGSAPNRAA
jgi:hypothetical protein